MNNPTEPYLAKADPPFRGTREELNEQHLVVTAKDYDALRAQVATLTRERDEANRRSARKDSAFCGLITERDAALSDLSDLRREAEQLREDKVRLEAERNEIKSVLQLHQLPYEPDLGVSVAAHLELAVQDALRLNWLERRSHEEISEIQWLNNIRSAIDAAMSRARETEGEG